jgi:tyrosinase
MILNRRTLDLLPFWKNDTEFHRSSMDTVRDITQFGATYPEFVGLENASDEDKRASIRATKVNKLYDPSNKRRDNNIKPPTAFLSADVLAATKGDTTTKDGLEAANGINTSSKAQPTALEGLDWFVRIRVMKFEFQLQQSFTVFIFLGQVSDEVSEWRSSPNLVGSYGEFVNSTPNQCPNCRANSNLITEGFFQLDDVLERLKYGRKNEKEIDDFIREEINWKVQKVR